MTISSTKQPMLFKQLLVIGLATVALTLSACNRKDESTIEGSALELDSQTSEAEAAAEINNADPMNSSIDSAILPSEDIPSGTGEVAGDSGGAGEVASAGLDMKDGMYTETSDDVANTGVTDSEVSDVSVTPEPTSTN